MSDSRRFFVAFFMLAAMVLAAVAEDDLGIARQALRDGLWDVARSHAMKVPGPEALLIVLEGLAGNGKWDEIGRILEKSSDAKGDGFDYYRAVMSGDHLTAQKLLKKGGSPSGIVEARLHEADMLAKDGKRTEATAIWRELAADTNAGDRAIAYASVNLMDAGMLRRAYEKVSSSRLRRMIGLRLGMVLLHDIETVGEGERLIREIVKDSPDADGAKEAFLAVAGAKAAGGFWKEAVDTYREAIEIWPDMARMASVQEGRGWALQRLGRREDALEAFRQAGALAKDEVSKATAMVKEGDVLSEMGRAEEAATKYREVMANYPKTTVAEKLKAVIELREQEAEGRRLYKEFRYGDAIKAFEKVGEADSARRQRMKFFVVLCLYGQGFDDQALEKARELSANCPDPAVRADALMWLAKFLYNRREWKESGRLFAAYSDSAQVPESGAEALLWASRAALADNDFNLAIQLSTRLSYRYPESAYRAGALLVQGEALVEQARFDEAVLVFESVAAMESTRLEDRMRARLLKADALYAMGADNPKRYEEALAAYKSVRFGGSMTASSQIVVAFKVARSLERLKRMDEAIDQYYSQVVIAYREGRLKGVRFNDEARASFSRAAFRLADEFESRGRDRPALHILELVAESDVPAAEEARNRIKKISNKGRFL